MLPAAMGAEGCLLEDAESDSLAYELLLRKSSEISVRNGQPSCVDDASTAAPLSRTTSTTSASTLSFATPSRSGAKWLRNVSIYGPWEDERMVGLVAQTRALSDSAFNEDCLKDVTKKSGWKLCLLASEDLECLCGFALVKATTFGVLSLSKIAVPAELRGKGFGKLMMDELMKAAKQQGNMFEVGLSSLPESVTFYQRLGFKAHKGLKLSTDEDLVEGQVYMEKKLRSRPRRLAR